MGTAKVKSLRRLLGTKAGQPLLPELALLGAGGGRRESFLSKEAHANSEANFRQGLSVKS